jgi:transcriptional regulator with XRE-family HTH domain
MLALGQAIRSLRARIGLSQKELARRALITPSFLSQVEGDHRTASLTVLGRIAEALGVAPEVLMWEAVELPEGMNEDDRRMCEFAKLIVRRMYENAAVAPDDCDNG